MQQPINIFIAYASKDRQFLTELRVHLEPLQLYDVVDEIWFDGEIIPGEIWADLIKQKLDSATIILLMISPDFLFSHYCREEMVHALDKHERSEATVVPIIVRPCAWQFNPQLKRIEAAIKANAISTALNRDESYTKITKSIAGIAQSIKTERALAELQAQEDAYWQKVQAQNTIPAYRKYVRTYPNGDYVEAAERAIQQLEAEIERKRLVELKAAEEAYWKEVLAKDSLSAYKAYLKTYKNGKYAPQALQAIDRINQKAVDAAKAKDNKAWQSAKEAHTKEAYQSYLAKYPQGLHTASAKTAIQRLSILIPEMLLVKGGRDSYGNDLQDFWIGKYQVTNEEYAYFLNAYGSNQVKTGAFKGKAMISEHRWGVQKTKNGWQATKGYHKHPIICVSWYGANEYCNWLTEMMGEAYRLPEEKYWEYAARGGQESKNFEYAGSNEIKEVAWYRKNSGGHTHPVGQKKPNELGLYDMSGNVWEWCFDHYDNSGIARVVRGGSWSSINDLCRVAFRSINYSSYRDFIIGFRVSRY